MKIYVKDDGLVGMISASALEAPAFKMYDYELSEEENKRIIAGDTVYYRDGKLEFIPKPQDWEAAKAELLAKPDITMQDLIDFISKQ